MEYVSSIYLKDRINQCWNNYKISLYLKYVKGKDLQSAKKEPPPHFVNLEEWHQFVDICNSEKFKVYLKLFFVYFSF